MFTLTLSFYYPLTRLCGIGYDTRTSYSSLLGRLPPTGRNKQVRGKRTCTRKYPPLSAPHPFSPVTMKGHRALHDMLHRASRHPTTYQRADYSLLVGST